MQTPRPPALNPALLPPGTVVGDWRVVAWAGRGIHGAVYRAVPVDNELANPVALKLALLPRDPRFAREAELLSCARHPSIPRLWEHGEWQHPSGTLHPFIVMDWIDGAPLYDWARLHNPSSQQVLRLLAQLASALQALHAQGCVHRDVKGDNVLVRHSDSRALLIDFGSGRYPDAATLTPDILPPGTPAYRSPEAWLFSLQFLRDRTARYCARPADDLYALGVAAYRLVTGEYPELAEPSQDEAGTWHLEGVASPAPLTLNPRVAPQLNALILRMLSVRPEERGPTGELIDTLEQAAQPTSQASAQALFAQETPPSVSPGKEVIGASVPGHPPRNEAEGIARTPEEATAVEVHVPAVSSRTQGAARYVSPPAHVRPGLARLAAAAVLLALGAWAGWVAREKSPERSIVRQEPGNARLEDGGTAGLGDEAATASSVTSPTPSSPGTLAEDALPEPLPGQTRPDAKGRCPHKRQVSLNGGCWVVAPFDREGCEALKFSGHDGYMFKGACYMPVLLRARQPTSHPVAKP
ncbi:MAG: serine/threonine protein kinase [Myxococcaceae bacterium]|nr:serine/threonine protein kinase [Myxococcaceae bacterium]